MILLAFLSRVAHEIQAAMERNSQTSALAEQMVQQKRAEEVGIDKHLTALCMGPAEIKLFYV